MSLFLFRVGLMGSVLFCYCRGPRGGGGRGTICGRWQCSMVELTDVRFRFPADKN